MKISKIRILQGDGPVSVNASLSKVVVTGFSNTKVVRNVYVLPGSVIGFHGAK